MLTIALNKWMRIYLCPYSYENGRSIQPIQDSYRSCYGCLHCDAVQELCPFASALAFGAALSELKFSNGPVAWHWHLAFHEEELALPTLGNTPRARGTSRRRLGAWRWVRGWVSKPELHVPLVDWSREEERILCSVQLVACRCAEVVVKSCETTSSHCNYVLTVVTGNGNVPALHVP